MDLKHLKDRKEEVEVFTVELSFGKVDGVLVDKEKTYTVEELYLASKPKVEEEPEEEEKETHYVN